MEKYSKDILTDKLSPDFNAFNVHLSYNLGGMNYFTGNHNPRGYWVHVSPVGIANGMRSSHLMGDIKTCGFKMLLEETKRKSEKRMAELWQNIEPLSEQMLAHFIVEEYRAINDLVQASKQSQIEKVLEKTDVPQ